MASLPRASRERPCLARQAAGGPLALAKLFLGRHNGELDGVADVKNIQVRIFDKTYTVQGELDEQYVQQLARMVDEKMHAIGEMAGTVDAARIAVLAALNLADELETYRKERGELRQRVERCVRLVETALRRPA
jgi:cell division protein ZapA